ncbi:unnamed protein product [Absidia cylindrospora]
MSIPSIEHLNRESPHVFIETVNTLFETAPPLANRLLAARPYKSYFELIDHANQSVLEIISVNKINWTSSMLILVSVKTKPTCLQCLSRNKDTTPVKELN